MLELKKKAARKLWLNGRVDGVKVKLPKECETPLIKYLEGIREAREYEIVLSLEAKNREEQKSVVSLLNDYLEEIK